MSQLTTLDPKARTLRPIAVAGILALLAASWFFLLRPIEGRTKDAAARKDEAVASLEASQLRLQSLESGQPDALAPLISVWESAGALLPASSSAREVAISMVEKVSGAGSAAGLAVSIQPVSDGSVALAGEPRIEFVEFSLTTTGSFTQFADFLSRFEELRPLLTVSSLTVTSSRDGLTLKATFSVLTTTTPLSGTPAITPKIPTIPAPLPGVPGVDQSQNTLPGATPDSVPAVAPDTIPDATPDVPG
jgi:Tfp pilus assembly protein PilO